MNRIADATIASFRLQTRLGREGGGGRGLGWALLNRACTHACASPDPETNLMGSLPSYLAARAKAAREAAQAMRQDANKRSAETQNQAPNLAAVPASSSAPTPPIATPAAQEHQSAPQAPAKPPSRRATGKKAPRRGEKGNPEQIVAFPVGTPMPWLALHAKDGLTGLDDEAVISAFLADARGNPAVIAAATPHIPRVMSAILFGACQPGFHGDKDRTRLFRMMGLPWADPPRAINGKGDGVVSNIGELAGRLSRAHARVAGRGRVTTTVSVTTEEADDLGDGGVTHLSAEQVRHPPIIDVDDDAG